MSHIICLMNVEADRASFTWSEGPATFEPYTLQGLAFKEFKESADAARERLADLIKDYLYSAGDVPQAVYALAGAGYELYEALFDPGADQKRQARQVRKWLERLAAEHEVESLEVIVDSPWSLPWNIIYDREPDEDAFLSGDSDPGRWRPFWGLRYNLCGGRKVDPLRRMPILKDPHVLMVVDPDIRDGLPADQRQRLTTFADLRGLQIIQTKDELKAATKAKRPDLLYWMSHADPDALILSQEPVSPRNLRRLLKRDGDEDLGFGGLAFLNACRTAECAGEEGSFFEAFHSVGFAGMIGTENLTIDRFANSLGLDFLEAFLDRGEPVGSLLRHLRARVPLGLLYGTYCPPDIRVDQGDDEDSLDIKPLSHIEGTFLGAALADEEIRVRQLPPLPTEPYRSLAYYERGDRALFAGRDDDCQQFAEMLDEAATRMLILHGESGVGKSSFLHAGVIPYLEEECLGYRFLRESGDDGGDQQRGTVLFIRATNDLCGQVAHALSEFCFAPYEYQTPQGDTVQADLPGVLAEFVGDAVDPAGLRATLDGDGELLGRLLSAISDRLPFSAILVIDQAEEVFTLAQTPEDLRQGRRALDMLRRTLTAPGDFKLIVSLRTEYYGRLIDRLRRGLQSTAGIREYLLTDFDETSLIEAIRRPTAAEAIPYTAEVPIQKYGFRYAEGVAEEIARRVVRYTTQRRDSVLPLVQVICAQLYGLARQRRDRTLTIKDLDTLGGIEGGMRRHVEGLLDDLLRAHPRDLKPLQRLFTQLYLKQPDGTLTTALLAEDEVRRRWKGRMPLDELLYGAQQMRLLKVNSLRIGGGEERRYVSLGHDALAKLAAEWDEELSRGARLRKMTAAITAVSAVAVVMAVLAILAWTARNAAQVAKEEAQTSLKQCQEYSDRLQEANDEVVANWRVAQQAKEEALKRLQQSRQFFDEWLLGVSGDLQFYPGLEDTRRRLLKEAATHLVDRIEVEEGSLAERAEAAKWQLRLGDVHYQHGLLHEAKSPDRAQHFEQAKQKFRAAQAAYQILSKAAPDNREFRLQLANSWIGLGMVVDEKQGSREKTVAELENALNLAKQLLDEAPDEPDYRNARARAQLILARLIQKKDVPRADKPLTKTEFEQADKLFSDAADTFKQLAEEAKREKTEDYPRYRRYHLNCLNAWSQLHIHTDRYETASKILTELVAEYDAMIKAQPQRVDHYEARIDSRLDRAFSLIELGRHEEAANDCKAVIADYGELLKKRGLLDYVKKRAETRYATGCVLQNLDRDARDVSWRAALDDYDVLLVLYPEQDEKRKSYRKRRDEIANLLEEESGKREPESAPRTTSLDSTITEM